MTMRTHGNDIHHVVEITIEEENIQAEAQREAALLCEALLHDAAQPTLGELLFATAVAVFAISVTVFAIIGIDRFVSVMFR